MDKPTPFKDSKNLLISKGKVLKETYIIEYFPILRFTNLPHELNMLISYIVGWNKKGNLCFISTKVCDYCNLNNSELSKAINFFSENGFITGVEKKFANNKKSTGYHVNIDVIMNLIESNPEYQKLTGNNLDTKRNNLKNILNGY